MRSIINLPVTIISRGVEASSCTRLMYLPATSSFIIEYQSGNPLMTSALGLIFLCLSTFSTYTDICKIFTLMSTEPRQRSQQGEFAYITIVQRIINKRIVQKTFDCNRQICQYEKLLHVRSTQLTNCSQFPNKMYPTRTCLAAVVPV